MRVLPDPVDADLASALEGLVPALSGLLSPERMGSERLAVGECSASRTLNRCGGASGSADAPARPWGASAAIVDRIVSRWS